MEPAFIAAMGSIGFEDVAHDACIALRHIGRMYDGADCRAGADEHVVAYLHLGLVENREVEIAHKVLADVDVESHVAVKRTVQRESRADRPQYFTDDSLALGAPRGEGAVEPVA